MKNKVIKRNDKRIMITAVLLIVSMATGMLFGLVSIKAYASNEMIETNRTKTYTAHIPMLEDNFKDDRVNVVLRSEYSKVNRVVRVEEFGIDIEKAGLISSEDDMSAKNKINSDFAILASVTDKFRVENPEAIKQLDESGEFCQILSLGLMVKGKEKVLEAITELKKSKMVAAAEPDYNYEIREDSVAVNNTYDSFLTLDTHSPDQWALPAIDMEQAWTITKGSLDVKVGLIEAGFQKNHLDLKGRLFQDVEGAAGRAHGTHVAGIIGAATNNGIGIAGVAESSLQLLGRVDFEIFMERAKKFKIVNASFVSVKDGIPDEPNDTDANYIYNFGLAGGLMICSAGNDGNNTDSLPQYPACYSSYEFTSPYHKGKKITNILSVGATDSKNERATYSNYGEKSVDLYAPGGGGTDTDYIISTFPEDICKDRTKDAIYKDFWTCELPVDDTKQRSTIHIEDGYHGMSGTSMAAPHVTGVAALLLSLDKKLTNTQIKEIILKNCETIPIKVPDPKDSNKMITKQVKFLNAHKALSSVAFKTNNLSSDTVEITGLNFTPSGPLALPDTIDGKTVTSIGEYAFSGQEHLTNIIIPDTITSIGFGAFADCIRLGTSKNLGLGQNKEVIIPNTVTNIFESAFFNCINLEKISISSGMREIAMRTFKNCRSLEEVVFNGTTLEVISDDAFYGCTGLMSFSVPENVKCVGFGAFEGCIYLNTLSLPFTGSGYDITNFSYIFGNGGVPSNLKNVKITGWRNIAENAFYNCSGLTQIIVPDTITNIGNDAFFGCTNLTEIIVRTTVASLNEDSFSVWDRLSGVIVSVEVTIPDGETTISANAFKDCRKVASVTIPSSVTSIGANAFSGCSNLSEVIVLGDLSSVGDNAFEDCTLLNNITLRVYAANLSADDYAIFGSITGIAVSFEVIIPDGTTAILPNAFYGCGRITSVFIPASVTTIGKNAFYYCSGLTTVMFEDDSLLSTIGTNAFFYCLNLSEITLPNSLTGIGAFAFADCISLEEIIIPENTINIGTGAFLGCSCIIIYN